MKNLKIAIQKSGRLNEKSVELLKKSGLVFDNYKSSLISPVKNFPLEILFLRDDDIPEYVQDGIADLGIVGENVIKEKNTNVFYLEKPGFGKCSLKIAIPNDSSIQQLSDLNKKSIATSYPRILQNFLDREGLHCEIRNISGSVEISTNLGLSDAIFDIVSTGGTLKSNGLKPFYDVLHSEAILIATPGIENNGLVLELVKRIQSVLKAQQTKYVVLNVTHNDLSKLLPLLSGIKSPTVVPLADTHWLAVHTVILEDDFWNKINELKTAGAQGIVVMPIENIIL